VPSRVFRIVALRRAMSAALGFILLSSPGRALASQAQADAKTGSLQIDVVDPSGAAIAGAEIQVQLRPQGPVQKFSADASGKLSLDLQPGTYDVFVSFPGFWHKAMEVEVQEASSQQLPMTLDVGSYSGPTVYGVPAIATTPAPLPKLIGGCTGQEQIAELQPTDPAYADATEVEDQLDDLGIMVRCTRASKMTRLFRGEIGAAWFRSDDGIFEVLFLPKGQTFAHLKVLERRDGDRYLTSFKGKPYSAVHMNGSKPTYFVKRGNRLYSVWGDEKLAALLESRLPK